MGMLYSEVADAQFTASKKVQSCTLRSTLDSARHGHNQTLTLWSQSFERTKNMYMYVIGCTTVDDRNLLTEVMRFRKRVKDNMKVFLLSGR